ncbi:hypothetical protein [Aestuariivirga sp.]|uniref:hypothetical protein n=1 Tax=Aestuariivirga sp. TaxID=2650926 RepID=UPI00391991C7
MSDLKDRVEAMYRRDVIVAWAFVIGLWFAVIFVMMATWNLAPEGQWRTILMIGGAAVLLFNTASIGAMVKHYKEDKDFIYGLDIKHLDEMRGRRH